MSLGICGKVAVAMSRNPRTTGSHERFASTARGGVFAVAFALMTVAITALPIVPPSAAAQDSLEDLDTAEAELLRELEAVKDREAEIERREAQREAVRARRLVEKQRRIAEENEALRRAKEESLQSQIAREIEMQDEILRRQERNESAPTRDLLGAHAATQADDFRGETTAHLAPGEPEMRDLPRAIFAEKSITIEARTPGFDNDKKRKLTRLTLDADRDGKPEVVRFLDRKTDAMVRQEEDRDYDGEIDSVLRFERGRLARRELDTNRDGRPDIFENYEKGRQVKRTLDRDYEGTIDVIYEYEGKYLALERHDVDNNGKIDLEVVYKKGRRSKAEEDSDRDGRPDTWIRYRVINGRDTVVHIELDRLGRGFADTFESFEANDGKAVLARREEDLDGDGEIDIVSIYKLGKLVRREILKPEVVKL